MEIRFGGSSFLIIGTPEEVNEFVRINTEQDQTERWVLPFVGEKERYG